MASRTRKGRSKSKKAVPIKRQVPLTEYDHDDDAKIKQAQEVIKRLQRKYMHKLEVATTTEPSSPTLLDVITTDKPSPTKKREESDHIMREKVVVDKENELASKHNITHDSCNDSIHKGPIKRANRRSRVRERHIDKLKPQVVSVNSGLAMAEQSDNIFNTTPVASPQLQSSHLPSLDPTPIASPQPRSRLPSLDGPLPLTDNQSTPCMTEKEKRRKSSLGFSKLDSPHFRSSLSPAIDSYAYPPSPKNKQTEKSYKTLLNSYALPVTVPKRQPPKRKTKTESPDLEEWAEKINKEFEEVDDFELIIQ